MGCRRYLGSAGSLVFQSGGSFVTWADFMPNFPGYVELASASDTAELQTVVYDSPRGAQKAVRAEPTLGGLIMDAQGPCYPGGCLGQLDCLLWKCSHRWSNVKRSTIVHRVRRRVMDQEGLGDSHSTGNEPIARHLQENCIRRWSYYALITPSYDCAPYIITLADGVTRLDPIISPRSGRLFRQ